MRIMRNRVEGYAYMDISPFFFHDPIVLYLFQVQKESYRYEPV